MQAQHWESIKRLWPLGLCWLAIMLGDWAVAYVLEHDWASHDFAITMTLGYFFGQFGLAAILGGLVGRTWLSGWLVAVLLTTVAMAVCILGAMPTARDDLAESIAIVALAPALTLAACAPLLLMRGLRGWSLTLTEETSIVKERGSVEDLFLASVAVACSLSLLRVVSTFSQGFRETEHGMVMAATFFGFSLLLVVPATAVTFRTRGWVQRILAWTGIAVAAAVPCVIINAFVEPNFWDRIGTTLGYVAVGVGASSLTMTLGVCAIRASGFKLTRFAQVTSPEQDVLRDDSAVAAGPSVRRQARWLTAGLVGITLLIGGWLSYGDYRQIEFLESIQQRFGDQGLFAGGMVSIQDGKVVSAVVPTYMTDDDFWIYKDMRDLERLSLADSRVTDRIVDDLGEFSELRVLDLSNTEISDVGLEKLEQNLELSNLSVAGTRVTLKKALEAARAMGVSDLDLSELGVTDDDLPSVLELQSLHSLTLRGNPITDKGIAQLVQSPANKLLSLDLSDTSIDGSGLIAGTCPLVLILDGTQITDANLISLMRATPGISVSIKNTAVTAQVLKVASNMQAALALGGGQITENDFANLGLLSFQGLSLNGPEFTGARLSELAGVQWLDLSRSGITDAAFVRLKDIEGAQLSSLSLAHTGVTDAVLPTIERLGCYELDIRHTKITAQGLLRHDLVDRRILVSHDQFTPAELVTLGQRLDVIIDGQMNFLPGW